MSYPVDDAASASERYAAAGIARRYPVLHDFASHYGFGLDGFQRDACQELEDGRSVLVAAPTGSGKTVVGEFAIHLALNAGRKAFYTTPIKALSNQKYHDLTDRYGADRVGLLTGDNSVNGEAPIVVMTTEVLRNMLYSGSRTLTDLSHVVMDEVHYLADRIRGAVWEEVIIHLPESVGLVSLSATVSNAEEFGDWLRTVRGDTATILEERRPVPLFQHVLVGRRMFDLFADEQARSGFAGEGAEVNPELLRVARDDFASTRMRDRRTPRGKSGKPTKQSHSRRHQPGRQVGNGRRIWIPSRSEVADRLDRMNLLPAIVFIFSRAGCDAAVRQCVTGGVRLTTQEETEEIRDFVTEKCADLPDADLHVLGYYDFLDALGRGVAAHHAGLLPVFKECVEELFAAGLCKVVFATETLALGINMPARTVVLEKLDKWNGETHADITPGEYTQLTGRAGRRGLDVEGHAVALWQPGMNPVSLAGLASTRTYPLMSSFRPSYNMTINLVHRYGRQRSRELLESSFAQFQADRAVVGLARQAAKAEEALAGYAEAAECQAGDFMEYAELRRSISEAEKSAARSRREDRRADVLASIAALRPGDVIDVPGGKSSGWAAVVDPGLSDDQPRPLVVTLGSAARRLSILDFTTPVAAAARVAIPKNFSPRNPAQRRNLASSLRHATRELAGDQSRSPSDRPGSKPGIGDDVERLRAELRRHPCHGCPKREEHARWAERWSKLRRDNAILKRRIAKRTNSVSRQFDRVCEVLLSLGYLDPGDPESDAEHDSGSGPLVVSERGKRLMRLYSELDLVVAESMRAGLWDALSPPELAAVLSALVFETRRPEDAAEPRLPTKPIRVALAAMRSLWAELDTLERRHSLDFLRPPDAGFVAAAHGWASGQDLDDVLSESGLAAGDFVRTMKQLIDLAGQVADAAGDSALRDTTRQAIALLRHGVIAYSSLEPD
ncbi:MAG: DEAD/DEAH box helicase [Nocardioides sp.]